MRDRPKIVGFAVAVRAEWCSVCWRITLEQVCFDMEGNLAWGCENCGAVDSRA